jgi:hypothetical protein
MDIIYVTFNSTVSKNCGKTIQKFYLKYHLQTNVHSKYMKEIESLNNFTLSDF